MIRIKPGLENTKEIKSVFKYWDLIDSSKYKPTTFDWNGKEFCYISRLGEFIFPSNSDIDVDKLINEETEISLDDWELKKISNEINPKYILNQFRRENYPELVIKSENNNSISGDWIIRNINTGFQIEFSIKENNLEESMVEILICFPEKTTVPYNPIKIMNKSNFIFFILCKKMSLKIL